MNQYYQIKITLIGSNPVIYRRILINPEICFPEFHDMIQDIMGWEDDHLHLFRKGKKYYRDSSDDGFGNTVDYWDIKIMDVLIKIKDKMIYEYDFGDGWEHEIILEKIVEEEEVFNIQCIEGAMNCPPEDCGGIAGFYNMLEIVKNPEEEEYEEILEWLGDDYDPEYFDLEKLNELLKSYNKIVKKTKKK